MSDETTKDVTPATDEVSTGSEPGKKTEKTFTQAEVDDLIRKRDRRDVKKAEQALEDYKASSNSELDSYKKIVETQLAEQKKSLPETVTKLLNKLDPIEQLEWLADPENTKSIERKKIPNTPNPDDQPEETESHVPLPFGLGRR